MEIMVSDTIISELGEEPQLVAALARGFREEWPAWAAGLADGELEGLFTPGARGALPAILVAHRGGEALGTVALRPWFAEEPMAETPWVRQLYVFPRHRDGRVFRALAAALEQRAAQLGFRWLHAATVSIEPLLARRGWEVFRRVEHDGQPMAWLRKDLAKAQGLRR